MTHALSRGLAAVTAATLLAFAAGCDSDSSGDNRSGGAVGCGFVPKSALSSALGSDALSSTGSSEPDPETKLTTCTTSSTQKTGVSARVEVSEATPASLTARDNWRSATPTANPGCTAPSFINAGNLGGVSCVEPAAEGDATRVYVVSPTHIITVTLSLAGKAEAADATAALAIAQAVEKELA